MPLGEFEQALRPLVGDAPEVKAGNAYYVQTPDGTYAVRWARAPNEEDPLPVEAEHISIIVGNAIIWPYRQNQWKRLVLVTGDAQLFAGGRAPRLTIVGGDMFLWAGSKAESLRAVGKDLVFDAGGSAPNLVGIGGVVIDELDESSPNPQFPSLQHTGVGQHAMIRFGLSALRSAEALGQVISEAAGLDNDSPSHTMSLGM